MMELAFAEPDPQLAPYISAYYHVRFDYPLIEDFERADVGYLRLMFSGKGFYNYKGGHRDPDCPVMLLGPATETASYSLAGPLDSFGCVLLPMFWGGIVDADASMFANRALDGLPSLGQEAMSLFDAMRETRDVEAMGKMMDGFLLKRIKAIPADQLTVIGKIGDWLSCYPIPAPEALYDACALSDRQIMRLANRYFGAPPKMLARKFRALRTASRIIGTKGPVPDELSDEYSDRAHMIREIKHFTGMTPRNLQVNSNPIMQVTLHPDNFRADAPWT
jgi:AraC-like DNA-binding protein